MNGMGNNILLWVIGGLLGMVNFLFWARIRRIENDVEKNISKAEQIERNYLGRFERMYEKLDKTEMKILQKLHEIELEVKSKK